MGWGWGLSCHWESREGGKRGWSRWTFTRHKSVDGDNAESAIAGTCGMNEFFKTI